MRLIKSLDQISLADMPVVGSKAYNCARLRKAGFQVPDGFVITSDILDLSFQSLDLDEEFERFPESTLFAVRSSAIDEDSAKHSFAGIHETKLNVTRDRMVEAVNACLVSVKAPRAIAYRRVMGLKTDNVKTGILIQEMIQPIISGVAFTMNPVTGFTDELVINASWGLGDALVSGRVER